MNKNLTIRLLYTILGIALIGFAVGFVRIAALGTDPFTTLNLGFTAATGYRYGLTSMVTNILATLFILFVDRRLIGLGSLLNLLFVGNISDIIVNIFTDTFGPAESLWIKIMFAGLGIVVLAIGAAMNIVANLGVSPYDALPLVAETLGKEKIRFQYARVVLDFSAVGIGFLLGAQIGVMTIVTAFFMGPLLQFFRVKLFRLLLRLEKVF